MKLYKMVVVTTVFLMLMGVIGSGAIAVGLVLTLAFLMKSKQRLIDKEEYTHNDPEEYAEGDG